MRSGSSISGRPVGVSPRGSERGGRKDALAAGADGVELPSCARGLAEAGDHDLGASDEKASKAGASGEWGAEIGVVGRGLGHDGCPGGELLTGLRGAGAGHEQPRCIGDGERVESGAVARGLEQARESREGIVTAVTPAFLAGSLGRVHREMIAAVQRAGQLRRA